MRTNKRARTHTYNYTLTEITFRNLVDITTKSMKECASFNPHGDDPEKLRAKYIPLYTKLIDIISEDEASKEDKIIDVQLSYGIVITNFNFIHGHLGFEFKRTVGGVEWKYIINFTNEDDDYVSISTKNKTECDAKRIRNKFALV